MTGRPDPLPPEFTGAAFRSADAIAHGIPESRLRADDLHRSFRGVRSTTDATGVWQRAKAYMPLHSPGEFFSFQTAALLHGMWLPLEVEQEELLHISVRKPQRAPRNAEVKGHHLVDRPGLVQDLDGLPVSNPIDTWCQLGTVLPIPALVAAGDELVQKGSRNAAATLERLVEAASDPNRPYHRRLIRAALLIRCGARSAGETRLRLLLLRGGLPEPAINQDVFDEQGRWVAEVDLVYARHRVAIEYEGDGHRERRQFRKDIRRYERLQDLGWRVIRVTADDLRLHPDELLARVRRALDSRGN